MLEAYVIGDPRADGGGGNKLGKNMKCHRFTSKVNLWHFLSYKSHTTQVWNYSVDVGCKENLHVDNQTKHQVRWFSFLFLMQHFAKLLTHFNIFLQLWKFGKTQISFWDTCLWLVFPMHFEVSKTFTYVPKCFLFLEWIELHKYSHVFFFSYFHSHYSLPDNSLICFHNSLLVIHNEFIFLHNSTTFICNNSPTL